MTNRERLARAMRDVSEIMRDDVISPTPFSHLSTALLSLEHAAKFVLDTNERDGVKS